MTTDRKSGFESDSSWDELNPCMDPGHNPPMHLHIPPGTQYRHVCPGCGKETVLRPPNVRF